jgi:hypothetical protein
MFSRFVGFASLPVLVAIFGREPLSRRANLSASAGATLKQLNAHHLQFNVVPFC